MNTDDFLVSLGAKQSSITSEFLDCAGPPDEHGEYSRVDDATYTAAERLCGIKASTHNLVLALDALDKEMVRPISHYSRLAQVERDGADYDAARRALGTKASGQEIKELATEKHAKRELSALAEMMRPQPISEKVRMMLVSTINDRGVKLISAHLGCVSEMANLIRSKRGFQRVATIDPVRAESNKPHLFEIEKQLKKFGL